MKSKRLKARELTHAEFIQTVNDAAATQARLLKIVARRDLAIVKIQQEFAETLGPLEMMIKALVTLAKKYATEHRAALLPKDKKSVELALATYGWRTGNRTVLPTSKKVTEEEILESMKECGLQAYIRTVEEIAKDKILADAKFDEVLGCHALENDEGALYTLPEISLKISQAESFYIEPKAESGETLKTEAA